ncbi:hypothetical protein D3879_01565 [Pseudomonas cavernicola]|uniref:Immunity protein 45 domain-containing protein n=1 Tax=Pseudomonas cavernicola TaxID=2320866 RepID=A0A418XHV1_9PSED|nr:Imm45 family immunity protein [Pseudomonas cavernicola]RJG12042.1 hypothetical protein D3879_01565 [Pseudomonas cavernicola]
MKSTKLVDYSESSISRGAILRLPAKWPYEAVVDFMVVDFPDPECGHTLIVSSGNKAGLVLIQLPRESFSPSGHAISKDWLISNWERWIYPDCPVEFVYILERYNTRNKIQK